MTNNSIITICYSLGIIEGKTKSIPESALYSILSKKYYAINNTPKYKLPLINT